MQNPSYRAAAALIDALAAGGVEHACVAPGSRSTPLALLLAAHPRIRVWSHIDERCAGFFALGLAKASGAPVVVACTSGTAAANLLPAIVEAHHARVPLIALTADRPPELRDCAAGQTIDQIRLYGGFARWFCEAGAPDASPEVLRHFARIGSRAAAEASGPPRGVAHVNLAFREPLAPEAGCAAELGRWFGSDGCTTEQPPIEGHAATSLPPPTHFHAARCEPAAAAIDALAAELGAARRAVIVCGPNDRGDARLVAALQRLAHILDAPIVAEAASNLRCAALRPWLVEGVEALARDTRLRGELLPDAVLRLGAPPTSRAIAVWLDAVPSTAILDESDAWPDPSGRARHLVQGPLTATCARLASALETGSAERAAGEGGAPRAARRAYHQGFAGRAAAAREALARAVDGEGLAFEGHAVRALAASLPADGTLYVANSLAIRALDFFWPADAVVARVLSNRGANGIDGFVSSVLGAAAVSPGPVVALCGDLSFLHDLSGLLAARRHGVKATFLVVQNDGGGIFDFLPVARAGGPYEELFVTPHGLDFRALVEGYGARFARVARPGELPAALERAVADPRTAVVELVVRRADSVAAHERAWQRAGAALAALAPSAA